MSEPVKPGGEPTSPDAQSATSPALQVAVVAYTEVGSGYRIHMTPDQIRALPQAERDELVDRLRQI